MSTARNRLKQRVTEDLIGPLDEAELIRDRPSDRYLTGILYPQRCPYSAEDDDDLSGHDDEAETDGSSAENEAVGLIHTVRPASAGISFAVKAAAAGAPQINATVVCGTYKAQEPEKDPEEPEERRARRRPEWQREGHSVSISALEVIGGEQNRPLEVDGLPGLSMYLKASRWNDAFLVTLALVNTNVLDEGETRRDIEEKTFFQVGLSAAPGEGTRIIPRPATESGEDGDLAAASLIYRNAREYAVGHTSSAGWEEEADRTGAKRVYMDWMPEALVPRMRADGHDVFRTLRQRTDGLAPLSASWLAEAAEDDLLRGVELLPAAYRHWIMTKEGEASDLAPPLKQQAKKHLTECGRVADRLEEGVQRLADDPLVLASFRLANQAIQIQRKWLHPEEQAFHWRPFQLAFVLLSLCSLVDGEHPDRAVMDLLWFPTGGGKTEAYLLLIAITLFHRRLSRNEGPDTGAGVAVLMRYTLRLLTAQQFQRACAVILACELLRLGRRLPPGPPPDLGSLPFSIGLWVGDDATANRIADAVDALAANGRNSPAQLDFCPACQRRLQWAPLPDESEIRVRCVNLGCELGQLERDLPIWTVDDDVYRETPSLVIGTADKFAQIVRKKASARLFGVGTTYQPPELIIQDELHLISGPLGTMAAEYEIAVDALCSRQGTKPKLIGSTATIRRAETQIRALFDRDTLQFPPPGLDADDSGFAVVDRSVPGRLYLGVTTAGRSAKFTLQAVSASLLQSAVDSAISDEERDGYWTLVTYFNSLRELGGALVLMQDDVGASISEYGSRRNEPPREAGIIEELTSRRSQIEIRDKLQELQRSWPDVGTIDVLLATNMISVGVDIPRLGLMVVNGQPKGIAEYIQATSRVGRAGAPGLIVSIYNNAKARDRSHYETFSTWHNTLYREVEASSVTPYASRARDRALHAPLVAVLRHTLADMENSPKLTPAAEASARAFADEIVARARRSDPEEAPAVQRQLNSIINDWVQREPLTRYWDDNRINTSLLISAEKAAAMRAAGRLPGSAWATPNNLRNVDPGTPFVLAEILRPDGDFDDEADNAENQ
jgi:hypothetical protein